MTTWVCKDGVLNGFAHGKNTIVASWRGPFGFVRSVNGGPFNAFLPDFAFLDEEGQPELSRIWRGGGILKSAIEDNERAITAYYDTIPLPYRRLAGAFGFGQKQWIVLESARYVPGFARFLRREIDCFGTIFITACWAAVDASEMTADERCQFNIRVMTEPRAPLLSELYNLLVDRSAVRLLRNFSDGPLTRTSFETLFQFASHTNVRSALSPLDQFDPKIVEFVSALPLWLAEPWFVRLCVDLNAQCFNVKNLIPDCVRNAAPDTRASLIRSLKDSALDDGDDLYAFFQAWAEKISGRSRFPEPPIGESEFLVPIASYKALKREALEMSNCVKDYDRQIQSGTTYFYQWTGEERATVQVSKATDGVWGITEALGKNNDELSEKTVVAIYYAIAAAQRMRAA